MNIVTLIDCMDYMKNIPDKFYELAIVDPPYGIGYFMAIQLASTRKRKNGIAIPKETYFQ